MNMVGIILCGDAPGQLQALESESIYACVTSLPYYNYVRTHAVLTASERWEHESRLD